jgi:peptide/nickel transport system permease protein
LVSFILRRSAIGFVLLFVVLTLVFLALHSVPGDPAMQLLAGNGSGAEVSEDALQRVREQLGLDKPLAVQYWLYLTGVLTFNFGNSFVDGSPVFQMILERLPNTWELVGAAVFIALVLGVLMGSWAARRGGSVDSVISVLTSVGMSIPVYVVGVVMVLVMAVNLRWFAAGGFVSFSADPAGHLGRLALPVLALSIGITSIIARMSRSAILENIQQDWVRTANSLGLSEGRVFRRHVLRNSLTPILTLTGLQIGALLGSTVLVERVFNWPGMGSLLVEGITSRDYPVVQGVVIVLSSMFILINICVDVLYGVLDPRVRSAR